MGCWKNKKAAVAAVTMDVEANACSNTVKYEDQQEESSKGQLVFLLCVAALALTSIVMFTEQLVVRHLAKQPVVEPLVAFENQWPQQQQTEEIVDILQLEDWAHSETIEFDNVISVRAIDTLILPPPEPTELDAVTTELDQQKQQVPSRIGSVEMVDDGVYWSSEVEAMTPPGLPEIQVQSEIQELRGRTVAHLESPDWLHCGRDMNRFVTFADGSKACARNRGLRQELIQGEVMAFHLARLLGIANTPVVVLSETSSKQWNESTQLDDWLSDADATTSDGGNSIVALIQWIPRLTKTPMPVTLRERLINDYGTMEPINQKTLRHMELEDVADLVQWSDLIVFDYLTGNYDRIVSMMDAAEKEGRLTMMRETVQNLAQSTKTSSLWMLDNESAFLNAYALLYRDPREGQRFLAYHEKLLQSFCVFRRKTVERLMALKDNGRMSPDKLLLNFVDHNEPLFRKLPTIHSDSTFSQNFGRRLDNVLNWVQFCRS